MDGNKKSKIKSCTNRSRDVCPGCGYSCKKAPAVLHAKRSAAGAFETDMISQSQSGCDTCFL